jgi:hypothetical protein
MDAEEHMEEISADLASLSAKLDAP